MYLNKIYGAYKAQKNSKKDLFRKCYKRFKYSNNNDS